MPEVSVLIIVGPQGKLSFVVPKETIVPGIEYSMMLEEPFRSSPNLFGIKRENQTLPELSIPTDSGDAPSVPFPGIVYEEKFWFDGLNITKAAGCC